MATLHEALQCLKPTSWDEVPRSPDDLRDYVREIFKNSRLVAESLPDPPISDNDEYPGLDNTTNSSARRIVPSSARVGETDPEITDLQKEWGKPLKMGGPKDNPLDVTVWKLSANDGKGSWFGRRSVHEGLPFSQWRKKLSTEYDETLKINRKKIEKGQTPDKSIRGIGAEEKIETIEIKDHDSSILGDLMVYHVSAQFPKPTAPRDFVELIINSDSGLQAGGTKQPGRSWIMISKPCDHPDIRHKPGYTRGEYESIELIREIPKKGGSESSSPSQGSKKHTAPSSALQPPVGLPEHDGAGDDEDEEMNPVEWIMVTRSDPGGNIPRWMVDKGTPRSVGTDAAKFINWAVQDDKPPKQEAGTGAEAENTPAGAKSKSGDFANEYASDQTGDSDSDYESLDSDGEHSHHGLIASVTGLLNIGLERLAPQVLGYGHGAQTRISGDLPPADEVSHIDAHGMAHLSPKSVQQNNSALDAESSRSGERDNASFSSGNSDQAATAINEVAQNNMSPEELIKMTKNSKLTSHEKELAKLAIRKREVEAQLDEIRAELDKLQIPSQPPPVSGTPLNGISEAESDTSGMRNRSATNRSSRPPSTLTQQSQSQSQSQGKISNEDQSSSRTATPDRPAHLSKAASHFLNGESKLLRQLRKIEASQLKVASKIQSKQRKEAERSEKSKSKNKSEVEALKHEVHDLKKELKQLRSERQKWIDLVSSLQAENTKLAAKSENA
ncbi:uncharacterized protein N7479_007437 [Penicillium vulpinum]|uniref:DUF3074 domain-containing protein n=1 Tax=Penicillium vulpinum TaxID=29845 RepID=A0A1V6SBC9_9EURO|nr:uncharacterized protein N7479_007437 [Penicillium vulpinum]KAJ5960287.1 hypothetical protein N7479_007437 [Penicillium vulpinum]OQE11059.1 hypothetical protein PENVUL_c003G01507 [Penicillium vulpinum]